ncbi:hypothetical protein [Alkalihalobacillus sp. AL-G]|uniref:hypothetical protein n=1 Tax=Alkalihalobacillus sp. AL-G TaxID=2926399 RepID=UPI00272BE2F0|nr:hypothetical protein [Alkalihalobacillus sp. AL-G]WLD93030.1 hypothetical protein MOJ78_18835 [Alkalihalobacillus sp. AL-G]
MNKQDLVKVLTKEKIPNHFYSLDGGLPYDAWCLRKTAVGWEVYYSEHGEIYMLKNFTSEEKACEYMYKKLKNIV